LDGDGQLDLLTGSDNCCDREPGIYWFRRGADGRFAAQPKVRVNVPGNRQMRSSLRVALADWDGDGQLDIIANQTELGPWLHMSEGAWSVDSEVTASRVVHGAPAERNHQPCVLDWDRDGRLDLIVAEFRDQADNKPAIFEINWHRNLSASGAPKLDGPDRQIVTLLTIPYNELDGLSAGDWDGDGWPDLIVAYHRGKYHEERREFEVSGVRIYPRRPLAGSRS